MLEYFKFDLKRISLILLCLLPVSLITGPAIPDISITLISIFFLLNSLLYKDFKWLKEKWIISGFAFWVCLMFISLFALDVYKSLENAFIFIRYIIFAIAVSYWLLTDKKIFEIFLKILTITIVFILADCLFQFLNYDSFEGYGKDIFGFNPTHYGRLSGPFNDDVPGSHISRFVFFVIFLFLITKKTIFYNNFTLVIFISFSLFTIWLSGEAMALATTLLGILIYFFFIKEKKLLVLIGSIIALCMILLTNKFHIMNHDYTIISSTPYHHGLLINKFGNCKNMNNKTCSKLIKTNPEFTKVIKNFNQSIYYQIYKDAYKMWLDNKFTGVGLNNYESACKNNIKYRSNKLNYGICSAHPHNNYIQLLTETGLIGFLFFIFFLSMIFLKIIKNITFDLNKFSFINFCVLFWPIMSTGSLLKNWYGIEVFLVLGLLISIINLNYTKSKL